MGLLTCLYESAKAYGGTDIFPVKIEAIPDSIRTNSATLCSLKTSCESRQIKIN